MLARPRKHLLAPFGLVLLSLAFGFYRLNSPSFWDDESFSYFAARLSWTQLWQLSTDVDPHTTLWHVILKCWYDIYEGGETWGRTPSVLFGAATVVAVWALCRRLFNERVAVIAGLLLALSTTLISYQHEARPYTLVTLLTTFGVLRLVVAIQEPSRRNAGMAGAAAAFAMYAHPFTALVFVSLMPTLLLAPNRSTLRPLVTWAGGSFLAAAAPCFALIGLNFGNDNLSWVPPFDLTLVRDSVSLVTGNNNPLLLVVEMAVLAVGVTGILRRKPRGGDWWPYAVVTAWLVLMPVLAFAIDIAKPVIVPRYLMPAVPAFSIALAVAIEAAGSKRIIVVAASAMAVLLFISGLATGHTHYRVNNDWKTALETVTANSQVGDSILAFHHEPVVRYELQQQSPPARSLQFLTRARGDKVDMLRQANDFTPDPGLPELLSGAPGRVWVVHLDSSLDDPTQGDHLPSGLPRDRQSYGIFNHVVVELLTPR